MKTKGMNLKNKDEVKDRLEKELYCGNSDKVGWISDKVWQGHSSTSINPLCEKWFVWKG